MLHNSQKCENLIFCRDPNGRGARQDDMSRHFIAFTHLSVRKSMFLPTSEEREKNLLGNSVWPSALIDTPATGETISQERKHLESQTNLNTQRIS